MDEIAHLQHAVNRVLERVRARLAACGVAAAAVRKVKVVTVMKEGKVLEVSPFQMMVELLQGGGSREVLGQVMLVQK
jgi:hypothetical protein